MNSSMQQLMNSYLDGDATPQDVASLGAWIKGSPENAAEFVRFCRLHDALHNLICNTEESGYEATVALGAGTHGSRRLWLKATIWSGGIAAFLALTLGVLGFFPTRIDAATEMNRLLESSAIAHDRHYIIHSLDSEPERLEDRRPPIDGAALYVRRPDCYVLERHFPDGRIFVTGSDGQKSWAIPPDGAVRVSSNPERFRGPLPGHQHGIPFADLRSDLLEMRSAYTLTILKSDASGQRGLHAEKKSAEYRGPRSVDLWYDAQAGIIHRIIFQGMPRAHGGPDRLAVELKDNFDLGPKFFDHAAHHDAAREVIEEDSQ